MISHLKIIFKSDKDNDRKNEPINITNIFGSRCVYV